jgi:uncharacterized protein YdbL (DUF1318 family)
MKSRFFSLFLALATCLAVSPALFAADAAQAKAQMRERVASIDQLKLAEAVGETNRGFLEVRKPEGNAASVVEAENRDRAIVFAETAARTGSTADVVGRSFARQIAAASAPGVWLQRDDGTWYKK